MRRLKTWAFGTGAGLAVTTALFIVAVKAPATCNGTSWQWDAF